MIATMAMMAKRASVAVAGRHALVMAALAVLTVICAGAPAWAADGQPAATPAVGGAAATGEATAAPGSGDLAPRTDQLAVSPKPLTEAESVPGGIGGLRLNDQTARLAIGATRALLTKCEADAKLRAMTRPALGRTLARDLLTAWPLATAAPKSFQEKRQMQVFVTVYDLRGQDLSAEGRGASLLEALGDGAAGLVLSSRYRAEGYNRLGEVRISLDVTSYCVPYLANLATPFLYSMRLGVDGLVYENGDLRGIVLPWEGVRRPWFMSFTRQTGQTQVEEVRAARDPEDLKKALLRELLDRSGAQSATWRGPSAQVLRFEVQSYIERQAGGQGGAALAVYRVGPLVDYEKLSDEQVRTAVSLAADYLARTPSREMVIRDSFDPIRNEWNGEYDASRQAMAAQALVRLYQAKKEEWSLQAAQRLTEEMAKRLVRAKVKGRDGQERLSAFPSVNQKSQVAWSAQAAMALADLETIAPDKGRREVLVQLANTLLGAQKSDGSFSFYFGPGTNQQLMEGDKEDLTGESLSLLGLLRSYRLLGDETLLKAARKTGDYLVFEREKRLGRKTPAGLSDAYLVEAIGELDRSLVSDEYVRYAVLCVDQLLRSQTTDPSRSMDDELGGFAMTNFPETEWSTFCLRGLKAASRMAQHIKAQSPARLAKLGLTTMTEELARPIRRAEAYLMGMQYTVESAFYVRQPAVAIGGLRFSAYDSRISTVAASNLLIGELP